MVCKSKGLQDILLKKPDTSPHCEGHRTHYVRQTFSLLPQPDHGHLSISIFLFVFFTCKMYLMSLNARRTQLYSALLHSHWILPIHMVLWILSEKEKSNSKWLLVMLRRMSMLLQPAICLRNNLCLYNNTFLSYITIYTQYQDINSEQGPIFGTWILALAMG